MKLNNLILVVAIGIIASFAFKVYAGTLSMKTYYPAPAGFYKDLTVSGKLVIPCHSLGYSSTIRGEVWIADASCSP